MELKEWACRYPGCDAQETRCPHNECEWHFHDDYDYKKCFMLCREHKNMYEFLQLVVQGATIKL